MVSEIIVINSLVFNLIYSTPEINLSDDEPADDHRRCATTPHQLPIRNMVFDIHDHGDSGGNEIGWSKNMSPSRHRKWNQSTRRRLNHDPKHVKETTTTTSTCSSSTSWPVRNQSSDEESSCRHLPHFADEDQDYIVFCFREDGEFDVVKNVKQEGHNSLDSTSSKNSRAINRKVRHRVVFKFFSFFDCIELESLSGDHLLFLIDKNSLIMTKILKQFKSIAMRRG